MDFHLKKIALMFSNQLFAFFLKTKTRRKYLFCGVILCRKIRETPYNLRQNVIKDISVYFHPLKKNKNKLIITSPMKAYHIKTMSMINKRSGTQFKVAFIF